MDIKSVEERSKNMAKIRNANTKPEMYIRSLLHQNGYRFRVNYSGIAGKPDVYFSKKKVAIFIHGCFWHRHKGCPYAYTPKSNVDFWRNKLEGNRIHDEKVLTTLHNQDIRTLIIWECTIKKMKKTKEIENEELSLIFSFLDDRTDSQMEI